MSWKLLERFLESEHFNQDPSLTVEYLARYTGHIGIQHVLCNKLRAFSYEKVEFYIPQLCHLVISLDNESMAVEDFVVSLCDESVNAALLTFWLLQTYLRDLSVTPHGVAFRKCRRVYNRIQRIIYGPADAPCSDKIRDNVVATTVLASLILAGPAVPSVARSAGMLAVSQARKPRFHELPSIEKVPVRRLSRSRTLPSTAARARRPRLTAQQSDVSNKEQRRRASGAHLSLDISQERWLGPLEQHSAPHTPQPGTVEPISSHLPAGPLALTNTSPVRNPVVSAAASHTLDIPEQRLQAPRTVRRHSATDVLAESDLSHSIKIGLLRSNYLRLESQFLTALVDISNRLVAVPKAARLSALRAELALIAQDLPAEVDIPLIDPPTLVNGISRHSRHHRIVRLNPAEATSLNSAERVPYLLMLEVLRDDFDFDPHSPQNNELITNIVAERTKAKRRLFDITNAARLMAEVDECKSLPDDPLDSDMGDLASPGLRTPDEEFPFSLENDPQPTRTRGSTHLSTQVSPTSGKLRHNMSPHSSDMALGRSGSPAPRVSSSNNSGNLVANQQHFQSLASHMRTASQMLTQLEQSGSKRPKAEVAAIKEKIIASMQALEEQSFGHTDDIIPPATDFATILDRSGSSESPAPNLLDTAPRVPADELETRSSPTLGITRMENDIKTGGVLPRSDGDRDDPSAATFGEAWSVKKERIRRTSPYGWMPNWDLVSVIVKTGADLRQEAFACQLISVCASIWTEASIPVWVRTMRILVTGESSGLIETITNGVSLHSLKRSLTLSLSSSTSPSVTTPSPTTITTTSSTTTTTKRLATLKDHFLKTFGPASSAAYTTATTNFALSLAAYSTISYLLQLKDRHNGNILLDDAGHIIHIDFGFMLSNTPGNVGFEAAPFKLTAEYIDVLGGSSTAATTGEAYKIFTQGMKDAFRALRRKAERIITLVEIMGKESRMPCFAGGVANVVTALRGRFVLDKSEREVDGFVEELIAKSAGSFYTRLYDTFQYRTQGIY